MALRKRPPGPVTSSELPADLGRGAVTVEQFVPPSERPPSWWGSGSVAYTDSEWRQIRAMRRWQDAVAQWGAGHGLDRRALTTLGYWPGYPPPFEAAAFVEAHDG